MLLVMLGSVRPALAHPAVSAVALVQVKAGGQLSVTLVHDALAYALNDTPARIGDAAMYELLDGPEEDLEAALTDGRERFVDALHVFADGKPLSLTLVRAPDVAGVHAWEKENPGRPLPCKLEFQLTGALPPGARSITLQFPRVLSDVILTIDRLGVEPVYLPLAPGETSPEIDVRMVTSPPSAGADGKAPAPVRPAAPTASTLNVVWRYIRLGFTHIIPGGPDHALFVLGLFLLTPRLKAVMWQITTFTIAHSITLMLTAFHVVHMPSSIIEPTIAASIAFVAIENLVVTRVHSWRPVVAFVFGLVHGMGFASALSEVGLPTGDLVAGVLAFNVGVEGGHLLVLAMALAALGRFRSKPWYRRRIAIPASLIIATIALVWMVQRLM